MIRLQANLSENEYHVESHAVYLTEEEAAEISGTIRSLLDQQLPEHHGYWFRRFVSDGVLVVYVDPHYGEYWAYFFRDDDQMPICVTDIKLLMEGKFDELDDDEVEED